MVTPTKVNPATNPAPVHTNELHPDAKNPEATPKAPEQQGTVNNHTVTAAEPTATTIKADTDTASTENETKNEPKTKTWGEWFATPFTSIKNYFSGDEKTEEENTVTISTAIPPEKTLGERMISAVKTVLSYMALPFKFLGYVAYHVIYRPLNAFVIKPLKNAYNYFFNPEKYIAEHGSKNLNELARAAKEGVETDANKEWFKTRYYAAMAREEALKDAHKDEINRRKPLAAFHNLLKKKFNENTISLKDAKGHSHVVLKADKKPPIDEYAKARTSTEPEADFKKRLAAYESTVAEHNKAMEAYEEALAEAKKNNAPHPEKPAPLTVIRPERTLDKVSADKPEHKAFLSSREDKKKAAMVDSLTVEIANLKTELAKTYPGQQVSVKDEAEKVQQQAKIKDHNAEAHKLQEYLANLKLDAAAYQQSTEAQQLREAIDYYTQQANLIHRHCVIFEKEQALGEAKIAHANYTGDIADWKKDRDRLQLDLRAKRTYYEAKRDEEGNIIKVARVDYQFDKRKLIKDRPLPITKQGLSWSKANLEERPYNQYGTIYGPGLGKNREVIGWDTIPGKEKFHWFVPADKVHNKKDLGYNKHQPVVAPGTRNGKPLSQPLPKPSQDKEVRPATEELQNGINTPDQKKSAQLSALEELKNAIKDSGIDPDSLDSDKFAVDPKNPLAHVDGSKLFGESADDDSISSISDSYDPKKAERELDEQRKSEALENEVAKLRSELSDMKKRLDDDLSLVIASRLRNAATTG